MKTKQTGSGEHIGQGMTGTGGDFLDQNDVEGHVAKRDDAGDGIHMKLPKGIEDEARSRDVEGHRARSGALEGEGIHMKLPKGIGDEARTARDGDDVEGHLYHGGPTTQGEARSKGSDNLGSRSKDIEGEGIRRY